MPCSCLELDHLFVIGTDDLNTEAAVAVLLAVLLQTSPEEEEEGTAAYDELSGATDSTVAFEKDCLSLVAAACHKRLSSRLVESC